MSDWSEVISEGTHMHHEVGDMLDCGHLELIDEIHRWSGAYPLSVFPEPDHEATGHDPTLCSASMGRHVIGRLMELIREAELGEDES